MADIATLELRVTAKEAIQQLGQFDRAVKRTQATEAERMRWMRENVRIEEAQRARSTQSLARQAQAQARIQREGMAMARAHAQALQMDAARTAALGTAAAGTAMNFGKLRGATTTLAASMLSLGPGVTQIGAALGVLAMGSGLMVAVLLGLAAVAFAWDRITRSSREAKKAQEEALERGQRLVEQRRQGFLGAIPEDIKNLELQKAQLFAQIQAASVPRVIGNVGGTTTTIAPNLKELEKLQQQYVDVSMTIAGLNREREILTNEKGLQDLAAAEAAAAKRLREELSRLAATYGSLRFEMQLTMAQGGAAQFFGVDAQGRPITPISLTRDGLQRRGIGQLRLPSRDVTAIQAVVPTLPTFRTVGHGGLEPISPAARRLWKERHGGGGIGGWLETQLDPRMIASGLASGGLSTAFGMVQEPLRKFVGGLLDGGKAAREFAREMQKARTAFAQTLDAALAIARDPSRAGSFGRADELRRFLQEWFATHMDQLIKLNVATAVEWMKKGRPELDVPGGDLQSIIPFIENWLKQNEKLRGTDAFKRMVELLELANLWLGELTRTVTGALTNVPSGFKIDQARYNASRGVTGPPGSAPPPPPRGPSYPPAPPPGGPPHPPGGLHSPVTHFHGDITVVAQNPDEFLEKLRRREFVRSGAARGPVRL